MDKKPYLIKRNRPDDNSGPTKVFGWAMLGFLLVYLIYTTISVLTSAPTTASRDEGAKTSSTSTSSTSTTTTLKKASGTLDITGNIVNVRSAPEVSGDNIIIRLNNGDTVKLIEDKDGWFKVELDDGRTGYIKNDPTIAVISEN